MVETVLMRNFIRGDSHTLDVYRSAGGYAAWAKAPVDGSLPIPRRWW